MKAFSRYNRGVTSAIEPAAEPEFSVRTIADLPFHVMGRFQKPTLMGRCKGGVIASMSSKELSSEVKLGTLRLPPSAVVADSRSFASTARPDR